MAKSNPRLENDWLKKTAGGEGGGHTGDVATSTSSADELTNLSRVCPKKDVRKAWNTTTMPYDM